MSLVSALGRGRRCFVTWSAVLPMGPILAHAPAWRSPRALLPRWPRPPTRSALPQEPPFGVIARGCRRDEDLDPQHIDPAGIRHHGVDLQRGHVRLLVGQD